MSIAAVLICLLFPALALWAEQRYVIVRKIGAVILCYICGIGLAAIGLRPEGEVLQNVYGIAAMLAVPLVLFSADLKGWLYLARPTVLAFIGAVLAAVVGAVLAYNLVGNSIPDDQGGSLAGMAVGVYTGGTPNLNAIALALGASEQLMLQANIADTLFFLPYFFFVMSIGPRIIGMLLPAFLSSKKEEGQSIASVQSHKGTILHYIQAVLLAGLCLAIALGISFLLHDSINMGLVVSVITILGLGFSLIRPIRTLPKTYQTGEYMLLIFCVGIGMSIKIDTVTAGFIPVMQFMFIAAGCGFVVHVFLAKIFGVDTDTFIITSVAAICSPLFVPPVARALGNRAIITSGMTTGVLGFAVGNWLGLGLAHLLG